jgi:predicted transcriptional regulator
MSMKPLSPTAQVVMSAIGRGYTRCGVIALKARLSKSHAAIVLGRLYTAGHIERKQRDGNHGRYPAYDYTIKPSAPALSANDSNRLQFRS